MAELWRESKVEKYEWQDLSQIPCNFVFDIHIGISLFHFHKFFCCKVGVFVYSNRLDKSPMVFCIRDRQHNYWTLLGDKYGYKKMIIILYTYMIFSFYSGSCDFLTYHASYNYFQYSKGAFLVHFPQVEGLIARSEKQIEIDPPSVTGRFTISWSTTMLCSALHLVRT